uniref:HTH_48 domain-containing protein n=1 Tax=Glossina pallidipes TaxID=7398 RepID=A0A1A9ZD97_GLOPL
MPQYLVTKIRVDNHPHIRHIIWNHFVIGWKAAQSVRGLRELFGEGTISQSPCREWFGHFKTGDTSLEDKPRKGRPSDFDDQAPLVAVEGEESLTTRMPADNFNVDHSTIVRRLKKLKNSVQEYHLKIPGLTLNRIKRNITKSKGVAVAKWGTVPSTRTQQIISMCPCLLILPKNVLSKLNYLHPLSAKT